MPITKEQEIYRITCDKCDHTIYSEVDDKVLFRAAGFVADDNMVLCENCFADWCIARDVGESSNG